jgi:hypothetical protein
MELFVCLNYVILLQFLFNNIYVLLFIKKRLSYCFGGAGVKARPQFSKRAYRRSQNDPAGAPVGYKFEGADGDALKTWRIPKHHNLFITLCALLTCKMYQQSPAMSFGAVHRRSSILPGAGAAQPLPEQRRRGPPQDAAR